MATQPVIRAFTEDDYELLVEASRVVYGERGASLEQAKHADASRDPGLFYARHVVESGGRAMGCGEIGHSDWIDDPDKYWFQILVLPDGSEATRPAYLDFALATLAPRSPRALVCGILESEVPHIRFLAEHRFLEVHREHWSRIDLAAFEPDRFAAAIARVAGQGIRIVTLPELQAEVPEWKQSLHPIYEELVADQPAPDPPRLDTLEEWERSVLGAPDYEPALWILGMDGDRVIGLSQAGPNLNAPATLDCGLTGVVAPYRRRGIATALKVQLLAAARQSGAAAVTTSNEANNPMYRINLGLGFVPGSDWVMFERKL